MVGLPGQDAAGGCVSVRLDDDPGGPVSVEEDLRRLGAGAHRKVGASHGRPQKGAGGTEAPTALDPSLVVAGSLLAGRVVIDMGGKPELGRPGDEGIAQRMTPVAVRDRQEPVRAAVTRICIADPALGALEIGQDFGVRPAVVSPCRPTVIIAGQAAGVIEPVDRA